jgi:hypothetical protein
MYARAAGYGSGRSLTETPPLSDTELTTIQKITDSVLYYSRAVDTTLIMPLNAIATEQTAATKKTKPQQANS